MFRDLPKRCGRQALRLGLIAGGDVCCEKYFDRVRKCAPLFKHCHVYVFLRVRLLLLSEPVMKCTCAVVCFSCLG